MGRRDQDDLDSAIEAARWLHRLKEPGVHQNRAPFETWLAASRANRREFFLASVTDVQMQALRRHAHNLKLGAPGVSDERILPFRRSQSSRGTPSQANRAEMNRPLRRVALIAYAAVFLAFVLGVLFTYGVVAGGTVYATGIGENRTVNLEDGTVIKLNTSSRMEVRFARSHRRIELLEGEAMIDVGRDPRPFEVRAGTAVIQDVGTVFNVRRRADSLDVAVKSGRVNVASVGRVKGDDVQSWHMAALSAGQAVTVSLKPDATVPEVRTLRTGEFQRITAWTEGFILLSGQRLGEVITDVNRYNIRQIQVLDPAVAALKLGGRMHVTGAEDFVQILESVFHVRARVPADPDEPIELVGIEK